MTQVAVTSAWMDAAGQPFHDGFTVTNSLSLTPARTSTLRLVSAVELLKMPDPNWLIAGILEEKRFAVLFGPPSSGKTFVAVSMAFAVCTGEDWHGHAVQQGGVLYVAGEGKTGLRKRTEAMLFHGGLEPTDIPNFHFVLDAIDLRDPAQVDWVVRVVREHAIKLVFADTLAHCAPGVDENSVKDMQQVVRGVQRITDAGAAVVALHHSTKADSGRERGSGALRAAADVMLAVVGQNNVLVLRNDKQKDEEQAADLFFRLERMELRKNAQGIPVTSCVLVAGHAVLAAAAAAGADTDNAATRRLVQVLRDEPAGLGNKDLLERTGLPPSTFSRALKDLRAAGRVEKTGGHRGVLQLVEAHVGTSAETKVEAEEAQLVPEPTAFDSPEPLPQAA